LALDRIFEGLVLNDSNAAEIVRSIVELTFFEFRMRGVSKGKSQSIEGRIRAALSVDSQQQIPESFTKLANDEQSKFGRRQTEARELVFSCLRENETKQMILPFGILGKNTKQRIFRYFAEPVREAIREAQEGGNLVAIKHFAHMLNDLAGRCDATDCLDRDDQVAFLKASWSEAKSQYDECKLKFKYASDSENARKLERRLKQLQNEASTLASELQKLLQNPQ
jgi:hypothetical protein